MAMCQRPWRLGTFTGAMFTRNTASARSIAPFVGHNYMGNDYMGHDYIGHNYIGRNYIGHDYMGHDYIGHNYIGLGSIDRPFCWP